MRIAFSYPFLLLLPLAVASAQGYGSLSIGAFDGSGAHGLVGDSRQISSILWNPAGLAYYAKRAALASFSDYLVGVSIYSIGYRDQFQRGGFGLFVSVLRSGEMLRTTGDDPGGGLGETFSYGEGVFGVSTGLRLGRFLGLGFALREVWRQCDGESDLTGFFDLGVMSRLVKGGWEYSSALCLRGVEVLPDVDDGGDGISGGSMNSTANFEVGFAATNRSHNFAFGISRYWSPDGRVEIRVGSSVEPSRDFRFAFGWRRRIGRFSDAGQDLPWHRGLWGSFGVRFGHYWLGYALEDGSPLDNIHRFTLSLE